MSVSFEIVASPNNTPLNFDITHLPHKGIALFCQCSCWVETPHHIPYQVVTESPGLSFHRRTICGAPWVTPNVAMFCWFLRQKAIARCRPMLWSLYLSHNMYGMVHVPT